MLSSVRRPTPQVTGISPKEGPPGTRVTIRGENLGVEARDLIGLRICGVDCLLSAEWKSPNKVIARTGQAKGRGDIIVVTRSGGVGSSTVEFRGYNIQIGPLQESAVWIDETQTYHTMFSRNRATSPMASEEHDDPLGISDESNDSRFPEEKLLDLFPEGSGNTSLDNFEPAWFLLENHHGTSFDDLKAGLTFLKRKAGQQNEGPMTFVKSNLTTFLDCLDTLTNMQQKVLEDKAVDPADITKPLQGILNQANGTADSMFNDVLGRKDSADATRNALGVLQRNKFLFSLPCTIERNINKGDYDLVITDYTRAKSLFGDTEVQVFKKVYQEVEKRIAGFRDMLHKKLMDLPSSVEEQKKLIRYLAHLETPGDPAWECMQHMQDWLKGVLHNCKEEHILKEIDQEKQKRDKTSPLSPTLGTSPSSRQPQPKSSGRAPQKLLFVDHLTRILCEHIPDIWRLGQSYFSGKLLKELKKPSRVDSTKHAHFKQMVTEVVILYSNLVRAAFLPSSLEGVDKRVRPNYGMWRDRLHHDSPIAWLPICVRHVRACQMSLGCIELPADALEILQELTFDLRWHCMSTLLSQATKDIQNLHARETWNVDTDDERGGTTLLPALFENIVSETIQHLQEVIQTRAGETELFSQIEIQKETVELISKLLQSFSGTLEQLAIMGNVERSSLGRRTALAPEQFSAGQGDRMPPLDRRLLIMMSNCTQTVLHILPRLVDLLHKHSYPDTHKVKQAAVWCYKQLDIQLFDKYIEEKANPVIGAIEQNMYMGKFEWHNCSRPTDVRNYLKEAIMGMIEIHAEVYSVSPNFVERVMFQVVEAVVDEAARLYHCVTNFNQNGALQARLEMSALQITIGAYSTKETSGLLKEAFSCVQELKTEQDKQLLEELLRQFKTRMKFQLMCFQRDTRGKKTAPA